ncbi:MAG: hypothetical protein O7B25_10735 [Gammaproteobacteria bacterium]|nr:hypothetical protein [Gammaproteobacteria bacterium]
MAALSTSTLPGRRYALSLTAGIVIPPAAVLFVATRRPYRVRLAASAHG